MKQEIEVAGAPQDLRLRPYEHHAQYYETDQMGIIHHSNYVRWMEEARMDLMDQIGLNYKQMEEMEIISPVLSVSVEYHSMVHFQVHQSMTYKQDNSHTSFSVTSLKVNLLCQNVRLSYTILHNVLHKNRYKP